MPNNREPIKEVGVNYVNMKIYRVLLRIWGKNFANAFTAAKHCEKKQKKCVYSHTSKRIVENKFDTARPSPES